MRPGERSWPCTHQAWVARSRSSGATTVTAISETGARLSGVGDASAGERLSLRLMGEAMEGRVTAANDTGCTIAFSHRLDPLLVSRLRGLAAPGERLRRQG